MSQQPPPLYDGDLTPDAKAMIGGFLLHYRAGFLRAAATAATPEGKSVPWWSDPQIHYYEIADSVTRFLLHRLGYTVKRGEPYPEFKDEYDPFLSVLRSIAESGFTDPSWVERYAGR